MDKTYAETQGHAPFDWNRFLDRAIAGEITDAEYRNAVILASNWVTCACGNQCAIIPRSPVGVTSAGPGWPIDDNLFSLGLFFPAQIEAEDWHEAKLTLRDIEARSAVLIAEELAKLQ